MVVSTLPKSPETAEQQQEGEEGEEGGLPSDAAGSTGITGAVGAGMNMVVEEVREMTAEELKEEIRANPNPNP